MKKEIKDFGSGVWSAARGAALVAAPAAVSPILWGGIEKKTNVYDMPIYVDAEAATLSSACVGAGMALALAASEHKKTCIAVGCIGAAAGATIYGAAVEEYNPFITTLAFAFRSVVPVGLARNILFPSDVMSASNQDRRLMSYGAVAALVGTLSMTPTFNEFANDVEQHFLESTTTHHIIEEPVPPQTVRPSMVGAIRG